MLDFSSKKHLPVKLEDGTELLLTMPKKELFAKMQSLQTDLNNTDNIEQLYDSIVEVTAQILSSNRVINQKRPWYVRLFRVKPKPIAFTPEKVYKILDISDMALLIREYSAFAGQIVKNPN